MQMLAIRYGEPNTSETPGQEVFLVCIASGNKRFQVLQGSHVGH